MTDADIIDIDSKIRHHFATEKDKLEEYQSRLNEVISSKLLNDIRPKTLSLLDKDEGTLYECIHDLENDITLNFYICDTAPLVEKFKIMIKEPTIVSFTGKKTRESKEKQKIVNEFLQEANKYVNVKELTGSKTGPLSNLEEDDSARRRITNLKKSNDDQVKCTNCSNKKLFDIILECNVYICNVCSAQQTILKNTTSYNDVNRINISSKYSYDRKIHFKDTINQYQGTQNCTVDQKVYDELDTQFKLHHLIEPNETGVKRYKRITKTHVAMFLKELNMSKHYENINLIHYNITGVPPDDISHLKDKLLEDFDAFTAVYDRLFDTINRKSFINAHFILYKFLQRHKHPCYEEDFATLKTFDIKAFHDDVFRDICYELEWKFQSSM